MKKDIEFVRHRMTSLRWSQAELAYKAKISRFNLNQAMLGRKPLSDSELQRTLATLEK